MTDPRDPTQPMGDDAEVAALVALDRALDELGAGRELPAEAGGGEPAALATLAAELQAAIPAPPAEAAERGRAAFLAAAAGTAGAAATGPGGGGRAGGRIWRRSLPLRVVALAAALVVLVAVPAAVARQARPGTALWPLREAAQDLRASLADPADRAHQRLNTAEEWIAAGSTAGEERREEMADRAEQLIDEALDSLDDVTGPRAAAERARAERLLLEVRALERQDDPAGSSGPGSGGGQDEDRSGRGGGDDPSGGDDRSGRGGGGSDGRRSGDSSGPGSGFGDG